jgi:hypothetical protein
MQRFRDYLTLYAASATATFHLTTLTVRLDSLAALARPGRPTCCSTTYAAAARSAS